MTKALYAGTFDPFTRGHESVVVRAAHIFDEVIVAVAKETGRVTQSSFDERIAMARAVFDGFDNIKVMGFEGLLSEFVKTQGITVLVRGARNSQDFEAEMRMANVNRALNPALETIFFSPTDTLQTVSGTLVREIHRLGGDISAFVPDAVARALKEKNQH